MNIPTTPDGMPSLASGAHDPHEGQACVMEYVSMIKEPAVKVPVTA